MGRSVYQATKAGEAKIAAKKAGASVSEIRAIGKNGSSGKTTPTVLTDTNIRENKIPEIQADASRLLDYEKNPLYLRPGETAEAYKARVGDFTSPPEADSIKTEQGGAPANEYDQIYQSVMGGSPSEDTYYDSQLELLKQMQKTSDSRTSASLAGITADFDRRKRDMQARQESERALNQNALLTSGGEQGGSFRYAPLSTEGFVSATERGFIRDLSVLDLEENQAKNDALAAQSEQDYKLLSAKLDVLKEKRKEKMDVVNKMYDTIIEEKKQTTKDINEIVKNAAGNGASPDVIKRISSATSLEEAYTAAGNFAVSATSEEGKAYNYAKNHGYSGSPLDFHREWEAAGRAPTGGSDTVPGYNGDFAATIGLAANTQGSVYGQKAMKDQLERSIAAGDYQSAYQGILQAAGAGLTAAGKQQLQNAAIDGALLTTLSEKLKEYKAAGGDMNLAKSVALDAGKKLGVLVGDKPYAELATELDSIFQQYRQNMTGAAFGAKESAEYQRVRPSKKGSFELNEATIDGAKKYADDYVNGAIRATVGPGGIEIKKRAELGTPTREQTILQKDNEAKGMIADWVAQSPENEAVYNEIRALLPDATPDELRQQLPI